METSGFPGKYRLGTSGSEAQGNQVAEGVHHRHDAQSGEQENQGMTETEVVIDGTDQHQAKYDAEQETGSRRDDEDPALVEDDGQLFVATKTKQPLLKLLDDGHQTTGMAWIRLAMSSGRA